MLSKLVEQLIDLESKISNKKIILFGTGKAGKMAFAALKIISFTPSYVIDNNRLKHGESFFNLEIVGPEIITSFDQSEIIILISSTYTDEISLQLTNNGFIEGTHFIALFEDNEVNKVRKFNPKTRGSRIVNGVEIGKYTFGAERLCSSSEVLIEKIGAFCSINYNVRMGFLNHPTSFITTHPLLYHKKDLITLDGNQTGLLDHYGKETLNLFNNSKNEKIVVGNDVWIGTSAIILPGVKIGNGAIIGAGAVVTKDVPDYAIVVGVPARILKYRFNEEQIQILNKVKWWEWEDQNIADHHELLKDPNRFFKYFSEA